MIFRINGFDVGGIPKSIWNGKEHRIELAVTNPDEMENQKECPVDKQC